MDTIGKTYIGIGIVAVIGSFFVFAQISRRCPKGTLLAVGAAVWLSGQMISQVSLREAKLIGSVCALSGFIGGLLGLLELFRKRKDRAIGAQADAPKDEPPSLFEKK